MKNQIYCLLATLLYASPTFADEQVEPVVMIETTAAAHKAEPTSVEQAEHSTSGQNPKDNHPYNPGYSGGNEQQYNGYGQNYGYPYQAQPYGYYGWYNGYPVAPAAAPPAQGPHNNTAAEAPPTGPHSTPVYYPPPPLSSSTGQPQPHYYPPPYYQPYPYDAVNQAPQHDGH